MDRWGMVILIFSFNIWDINKKVFKGKEFKFYVSYGREL